MKFPITIFGYTYARMPVFYQRKSQILGEIMYAHFEEFFFFQIFERPLSFVATVDRLFKL